MSNHSPDSIGDWRLPQSAVPPLSTLVPLCLLAATAGLCSSPVADYLFGGVVAWLKGNPLLNVTVLAACLFLVAWGFGFVGEIPLASPTRPLGEERALRALLVLWMGVGFLLSEFIRVPLLPAAAFCVSSVVLLAALFVAASTDGTASRGEDEASASDLA